VQEVEGTVLEKERPGSLKGVIDILPESVFSNPTWRGMAYFYRDVAMYLALLTALVFVTNVVEALLLEIVMALVVSGLFIVGHDAAHGALFSSRRRNQVVGRIAMLPGLHVFEGWVLGHNRVHHPFTVRQGVDFVWHPVTPEEYAQLGWWRRLLHRFEWSWAGAGVYYIHQIWWKKMMVGEPPARWAKTIRKDRFLVLGFIVTMLAIFSSVGVVLGDSIPGIIWLDVRVLVLPFVAFAYTIGAAVHVQHISPDIKWWKKAEWTKFRAQMEGTTVLRVPKGINFFLHWIMVHTPHHVDMRIPMYHLEEAAAAIEEAFPGTVIDEKIGLRGYVSKTRTCKLYDFDEGTWMTYREARRRAREADRAA